jgi:GNAT superfamily N-acetyltransferase
MATPPSRSLGTLPIEIGAAGLDHWSEIRSLHANAFRYLTGPSMEPASNAALLSMIYAPDYTGSLQCQDLQIADHDGRIIGTAGWVPADDSGATARIVSVYVSPLFGRLGVGSRLVATVEQKARAAGFRGFAVRSFPATTGFFEAVGYSRSSQGIQAIGTENGIPVVFMRKLDAEPGAKSRDDAAASSADPVAR